MTAEGTEPSSAGKTSESSLSQPRDGQDLEIKQASSSIDEQNRPREKESDKQAAPEAVHDLHHYAFPTARTLINWLAVVLIGYACMAFALTAHHIYGAGLKVGEKADRNIVANNSVLVADEEATEIARARAVESVMPVFVKNEKSDQKVLAALKACLSAIGDLQKQSIAPIEGMTPAEQVRYLLMSPEEFESATKTLLNDMSGKGAKNASKAQVAATLSRERELLSSAKFASDDIKPDALYVLASVAPAQFPAYSQTVNATAARVCKKFHRLPTEDNSVWIDTVFEYLPDSWQPDLRIATSKIMCAFLEPNIEIDKTATQEKSTAIAATVKPVMKKITVGQLIVPRGSAITKEQLEILTSLGITEVNRGPVVFTLLISLAAAVLFVGIFLYEFEPKQLLSTSSIGMMFTVSVMAIVLAVVLGKTYPQFVPLPAAALILTIFCGQRVAAAVTLPLAVFLTVDHLIDFNNLVALGTAAGAGIGFYSPRRHALMSTGIAIACMQAVGFAVASFISQTILPATAIGKMLGMEFMGGMFSSIVAIGVLPFLENIFGLITPFRLAELTDADQPLLRKLEENAPGTYQHSLAVANLAEAGARAISADVNLVRAGAFYHDVGKMVRPRYFIENQLGDKNPHDTMTPEQSRERVLAHVTDGIALAKEYRLPKAVQDFIPMHQGTSLMAYFYHKACVRDGVENVDAGFYRYPGPKPQSPETCIVMLADVSEAVTHSMKD
ncbi:MAG TPA: HDIG domain-containing metalloprotein, partial [Chroococcales cyanobacterium]